MDDEKLHFRYSIFFLTKGENAVEILRNISVVYRDVFVN